LLDLFSAVVRKNSCIFIVLFGRIAIEEGVEGVAVPVDVDNKRDGVGLIEREQKLLQEVDLAVKVFPWLPPNAVEVIA
jgi:hypothetical protein